MNISDIVSRINENTKLLSEGQISDIERDILLADLRELYTLAKGQATIWKPIAPAAPEIKAPLAPTVEKVETPIIKEPIVKSPEEVKPPLEEKRESPVEAISAITEPVITGVVEEVKEDLPVMQKKEAVTEAKDEAPLFIEKKEEIVSNRIHYDQGVPVRGPKVSSLNEVFSGTDKSINAVSGSGEKKRELNDRASHRDLKSLIDLNKQHVLTSELFKGDSAAFQSAISHINDSPTIEGAFEYIKTELLPKYKWNGDMQSARLFDKLVRQKFGV
jgi:hypothetical protein